MGGNLPDAQSNQNGGASGGHDAVVGRGGHAHAQHDAAQHGEEQGDDRLSAGHPDDRGDQLGGQTGGGDAAGHDAPPSRRRRPR